MAESWKPGGSIIEKDGVTLLELHGVKMVNKRPVKAVVYYSVAELKRFLYSSLDRLWEQEIQDNVKPESRLVYDTIRDDMRLDGKSETFSIYMSSGAYRVNKGEHISLWVDRVIELLKDRNITSHKELNKILLSSVISRAFGFNIWRRYNDTIYVPHSLPDYSVNVSQSSMITLPNDMISKEIASKIKSPVSFMKLNLAAKSVQGKKYEYEGLVELVPDQAFVLLCKLYEQEKDPYHKEHLFMLAIKAYSMRTWSTIYHGDVANSTDIILHLFSFLLQTGSRYDTKFHLDMMFSQNIEALEIVLDRGLVPLKDFEINTLLLGSKSIPDNFIPFIERLLNMDANFRTPSLYNDLVRGSFSSLYNFKLMVDAIKKGYIKEPFSIERRSGYHLFLNNDLLEGSQEDKELLMKYVYRNPFTDFFLAGIKPTVERIKAFARALQDDSMIIPVCIQYGMQFSDENPNYRELLIVKDFLNIQNGHVVYDYAISRDQYNIFFLKDLGGGKHLVLLNPKTARPVIRFYGPCVIRTLEDFFIKDPTISAAPLFIECLGNADENLFTRIFYFAKENRGMIHRLAIDVSSDVTDLELYRRYLVKMKLLEGINSSI